MLSSRMDHDAEAKGHFQDVLRQRTAAILLERVNAVTANTVAVLSSGSAATLDGDPNHHVRLRMTQLLTIAGRTGSLDARGGFVADLHRVVVERALTTEQLFTFA